MTDYNEQAKSFLAETGTSFKIQKAVRQRAPQWAKNTPHGVHYSITLENSKGAYTFDFWGSVNDKINGNPPNEYDVLACLSTETFQTFDDFCDNFGYDNDSIKALETYHAVNQQAQELAKLFTGKQLLALSDIL